MICLFPCDKIETMIWYTISGLHPIIVIDIVSRVLVVQLN